MKKVAILAKTAVVASAGNKKKINYESKNKKIRWKDNRAKSKENAEARKPQRIWKQGNQLTFRWAAAADCNCKGTRQWAKSAFVGWAFGGIGPKAA